MTACDDLIATYDLTLAQAAAWAGAIDLWAAVSVCDDHILCYRRQQRDLIDRHVVGGIATMSEAAFDAVRYYQRRRVDWAARRAALMAAEWPNPLHDAREARHAPGRTAGGMIEHNETQGAYISGLSAADEVALCARMGRLMDQAAAHRHACERLERAYGPTLPTPYKGAYATHYAKREALDAQIRALGSALYPDEGEESADELDNMAYSRTAALAGEAAHISGGAASPEEVRRMASLADPSRIHGDALWEPIDPTSIGRHEDGHEDEGRRLALLLLVAVVFLAPVAVLIAAREWMREVMRRWQ